ncbi:MAG: hypothetical protein B7X48_01245 [Acidiphilium sp. 34-60-192]|nr:MAG: hypothetical protein B7X48_01245 [Acidiphilium sp. 34-60-192]
MHLVIGVPLIDLNTALVTLSAICGSPPARAVVATLSVLAPILICFGGLPEQPARSDKLRSRMALAR